MVHPGPLGLLVLQVLAPQVHGHSLLAREGRKLQERRSVSPRYVDHAGLVGGGPNPHRLALGVGQRRAQPTLARPIALRVCCELPVFVVCFARSRLGSGKLASRVETV